MCLEKYASPNFMGLFVGSKVHDSWLKGFARKYVEALKKLGIEAEPNAKKSLHLSLAYLFSNKAFQALAGLMDQLELEGIAGHWEVRLYSKDPRITQDMYVHKVMHGHLPKEHDELELRPGDLVYLPREACDSTIDGWVEGTSWLTGSSGFLPLIYTKRVPESDAWVLHAKMPITKGKTEKSVDTVDSVKQVEDGQRVRWRFRF